VSREALGHLPGGDDRVTPIVEADDLGQQLCAEPSAIALDAIDRQP
jgi:hypothetical protein